MAAVEEPICHWSIQGCANAGRCCLVRAVNIMLHVQLPEGMGPPKPRSGLDQPWDLEHYGYAGRWKRNHLPYFYAQAACDMSIYLSPMHTVGRGLMGDPRLVLIATSCKLSFALLPVINQPMSGKHRLLVLVTWWAGPHTCRPPHPPSPPARRRGVGHLPIAGP